MDDYLLELMRKVDGVPDRDDWLTLSSGLFPDIRKLFEHPLLQAVNLRYDGGIEMIFRKKADVDEPGTKPKET